MKAIRIVFYAAGGLVLVALLAIVAAVLVIDGAFVKQRAERLMKEAHQRSLSIEGTPKLTLFPVAGIELGKVRLSEHASEKEFLSLDSARIAVRVMPMLSGTLEVEALSVAGFKANLVRAKDGRMNTDDLAGKPTEPKQAEPHAERHGKAGKLRISEVNIQGASVSF